MSRFSGRVWKYGDNVDTDVIIPARYLTTQEPEELAKHAMEDLDPEFASKVAEGDIVVAGSNFGSGSSREHAPIALKAAGVSCVIARSFARIFYRNAVNIGLPILECAELVDGVESGHRLEVDPETGRIRNLTTGASFVAKPLPELMQQILAAGGLVPYVRKRLEAQQASG